jgi:hypothetical protein
MIRVYACASSPARGHPLPFKELRLICQSHSFFDEIKKCQATYGDSCTFL